MKKLKGNKRKRFLKEVTSYTSTDDSTGKTLPSIGGVPSAVGRPSAAVAAAAAIRGVQAAPKRESATEAVARVVAGTGLTSEEARNKIKKILLSRDTPKGFLASDAADQIIKQYGKTVATPVPQAPPQMRRRLSGGTQGAEPQAATREDRIKQIAQIKQEANIPEEVKNPYEEFIDKLETGDYGAFYLHVVADLNYPRIIPEFDNQIKNLVAERTKLIQDNNLFIDPKTGEPFTIDNSQDDVIRKFYDLQKQIYEKENEKTKAILSKIDSTKLKNRELYEKIIAGDAGALNTFIENLKIAAKPEKRNMNNRSLYAIEALEAKDIATKEQVTDFRNYLMSNDLLERKNYIKLAKILF